MQLKLPIGRRGLSPAMFGYKRWSGLYHEQGRYLYINDGIGNVLFPLRVGAKPEITVITIKCQVLSHLQQLQQCHQIFP